MNRQTDTQTRGERTTHNYIPLPSPRDKKTRLQNKARGYRQLTFLTSYNLELNEIEIKPKHQGQGLDWFSA